ncbi:MAG: C39 family peptidase [Akkermansia sp.]|nr:C39 family peptidase [Akkermansia sp.]
MIHRTSRFLTCLLVMCSSAFGLDISESCKSGDFWNQPATASLQGASYSQPDAEHVRTSSLALGGLTTGEVIITVNNNKPVSLQAMLYNKGDDGVIDAEAFNTILNEAKASIETYTGVKAKLRSGKRDTAVKLKSWEWKWENGIIRLEANSSGKKKNFQGEFIRLNMAPNAKVLGGGGASDSITKSELRSSITTEEDGTVWLKGVPMVDQGQKGYCMPATLARIFAFYGMDKVDQHTLADLCDSGAGGGTTSRGMEMAMENVCKKFRTKFIILEDFVTTYKSILEPYNKLAKREDKPTMTINSNLFETADAKLLRQARAGKNSQISKWMKDIKKHIDSGSPVIWLVTVGIYPEEIPLPQSRGGHARLIIGYNLKEKTIIYTDSWGADHARKTIPAADAIGMTMGRYVIKLR